MLDYITIIEQVITVVVIIEVDNDGFLWGSQVSEPAYINIFEVIPINLRLEYRAMVIGRSPVWAIYLYLNNKNNNMLCSGLNYCINFNSKSSYILNYMMIMNAMQSFV